MSPPVPLSEYPKGDVSPLWDSAFVPYVCLRRGGVPLRGVQDLKFMRSVEIGDKILDLESQNTGKAVEAVAILERLIGSIPLCSEQLAVRREMIQLKRDIFNDRLPRLALSPPAVSEMKRALGSREFALVSSWIEARSKRQILAVQGEGAFSEELSALGRRLRNISKRPGFVMALGLASPALRDDLTHYSEYPSQFSVGQKSRMERSLIRYYTRSAVKLSPFSSFMRNQILRIGDPSESSGRGRKRPVLWRSAKINRCIAGQLAQRIAQHPELRQFVPVFATGALVRNGNRILVLRQRYDASRATRLRIPSESLVELEYSSAIAAAMDHLPHGQRVSFATLASELAPVLGGAAAASEFLYKLAEIGVLLHKIPLPQDDACALEALRRYLAGASSSHPKIAALTSELQQLESCQSEFARAGSGLRPDLIKKIDGMVQNAHRLIEDAPAPSWAGRLVAEEVIEEPAGFMPLPARWSEAIHDLRDFLKAYVPLLDLFSSVRASIRELLTREFGGGPVPFLKFAARYRQAIPVVKDPNIAGAALRNPFKLETLAELEKIRSEIGSVVTLASDSPVLDLRAAAQERHWQERVMDLALPGSVGGAAALTCFIQPCTDNNGNDGLVLNQIDAGPCRTLSRALAAFADQQGKLQITADLAQILSRFWKAEPCAIYAAFDYNLNSGPAITKRVIDYGGDAAPGDNAISLGSLLISVTGDGGLQLSDGKRDLIPIHFGTMSSAFQPLIPALLLALGRSEPILVRPFDPRNWGPISSTLPEAALFPRLVFGRCIVRRRGWLIRKASLPLRRVGEQSFSYFNRMRKWQRAIGLPDEIFVRVRGLGERGDEDVLDPRSTGLPRKPQYVDFRNYFLVESLDDLFKDTLTAAYFEEALPAVEDWASLSQRRSMEMAVDVFVPATRRQNGY
jgi:hypothetical protein